MNYEDVIQYIGPRKLFIAEQYFKKLEFHPFKYCTTQEHNQSVLNKCVCGPFIGEKTERVIIGQFNIDKLNKIGWVLIIFPDELRFQYN